MPAPVRARPDLEIAAIELLGTFVADEPTYDTFAADLARIEATMPQIPSPLPGYRSHLNQAGRLILVSLPLADIQRLAAGGDPVWDCLASTYGSQTIAFNTINGGAIVFDGVYDLRPLVAEYLSVPEVTFAQGDYINGGNGSALLISRSQGRWHYFFAQGLGEFGFASSPTPTLVHYVSSVPMPGSPQSSVLTYEGFWGPSEGTPQPSWWPIVEAIRAGRLPPAIAPVPMSPAAKGLLILLLAGLALWRLSDSVS